MAANARWSLPGPGAVVMPVIALPSPVRTWAMRTSGGGEHPFELGPVHVECPGSNRRAIGQALIEEPPEPAIAPRGVEVADHEQTPRPPQTQIVVDRGCLADLDRARLLAGSAERRDLLLRRCLVLRLHRGHHAEPTGSRHGADSRWRRLLAGGGRRRDLLLQQCALLRLDWGQDAEQTHRGRHHDARLP
jgi:hypothetical protein